MFLAKIKQQQSFKINSQDVDAGIVNYMAEELILTVKAGTTIKEIDKLLANYNQCLPFKTNSRTIGGAYVNGISLNQYKIRDFVLGIKLIDGLGREMQFGGEMLKNVAGFDVARMLIGSKGKLAVITQISFKVIPQNYVTKNITNNRPVIAKSKLVIELEQRLKQVFDPKNLFL